MSLATQRLPGEDFFLKIIIGILALLLIVSIYAGSTVCDVDMERFESLLDEDLPMGVSHSVSIGAARNIYKTYPASSEIMEGLLREVITCR